MSRAGRYEDEEAPRKRNALDDQGVDNSCRLAILGFLSVTMTGPAGASTCSGCEVAATCEGVSAWGEAAPCECRMAFTPKTAISAMTTRPKAAGANRAITEGWDGEAASEMAFCSSDLGATGLD